MLLPRPIYAQISKYLDSSEAVIVTGMRRTGKTSLLNFIYDQIPSKNKLYLDLENPLNRRYFEEENYEQIRFALETQGLDFSKNTFVFLDEIQFAGNLPSVVKYFIDHHKTKFFLTGSASFYLKNLFAESLAGRKYIFELFPLSFREFLTFKGSRLRIPADPRQITRPMHEAISLLYDEYMLYGGFPGVVLKSSREEKARALDDIFTSFFQLEVVQLGDFRKNALVRDLMLLLARRIGSKLDIQKLSRDLGVSRPTLNDYIAFLEGTYFIKTIKPFSRNRDTEIRKTPKVYLCDTGLANHLGRLDTGSLFENCVFQNLRLKGSLNYYQKKTGAEIDFVLDQNQAYEVKLAPQPPDLRKLRVLADELGLAATMVSKGYSTAAQTTYAFML